MYTCACKSLNRIYNLNGLKNLMSLMSCRIFQCLEFFLSIEKFSSYWKSLQACSAHWCWRMRNVHHHANLYGEKGSCQLYLGAEGHMVNSMCDRLCRCHLRVNQGESSGKEIFQTLESSRYGARFASMITRLTGNSCSLWWGSLVL